MRPKKYRTKAEKIRLLAAIQEDVGLGLTLKSSCEKHGTYPSQYQSWVSKGLSNPLDVTLPKSGRKLQKAPEQVQFKNLVKLLVEASKWM